MLDLDPVKLLLIAVVALIVLGPDKLPTAARKASSLLGDLQRMRASLHDQVQSSVKDLPLLDELHDLQAAARRFGDPRHAISRAVTGSLARPGADPAPGPAEPAPAGPDAPAAGLPADPAPTASATPVLHADFDPNAN